MYSEIDISVVIPTRCSVIGTEQKGGRARYAPTTKGDPMSELSYYSLIHKLVDVSERP